MTTITMNGDYSITADFQIHVDPMISAGISHTVGLKSDGTVMATTITDPYAESGQSNVGAWTDIIQVDAGDHHTVGLRSDGSVVATEVIDYPLLEEYGVSDVGSWTDIIQVAAGTWHTVGLKSNGTVVATGSEAVNSWTDIIQVAAGQHHIVGLRSDGTVVATPIADAYLDCGQSDVGGWTDIVQVAAGWWNTVGLKDDGTVVATPITNPDHDCGQSDVGGNDWQHIVEVDGGALHTVGRVHYASSGPPPYIISKVVAAGWNRDHQCDVDGWVLLTQIAAGYAHTVGLNPDGTVVVVGCTADDRGQCNVGGWDLDS
jgi:alpha-tubulin suppressor-like RCC1 family protein